MWLKTDRLGDQIIDRVDLCAKECSPEESLMMAEISVRGKQHAPARTLGEFGAWSS